MISYRPMGPDDRRLVVSSWSSSLKHSHTAGMIHTDDWADVMHRQIERALDRPGARTIVAYEHKDPAHLYAWISGDTSEDIPAVFYCYVKEPYRRGGIARNLFKALGVEPSSRFVFACRTAIVPTLQRSIPAARFNPAILRYPKEQHDQRQQTDPDQAERAEGSPARQRRIARNGQRSR